MNPRILVVEDEPLIALDLELILEESGYQVIGPAGSVEKALGLLEANTCDAAVLDQHLRGETVEKVASYLSAKGTPFVFVSGYGRQILAERYADVPFLSKPVDPSKLVKTLKHLLSSSP